MVSDTNFLRFFVCSVSEAVFCVYSVMPRKYLVGFFLKNVCGLPKKIFFSADHAPGNCVHREFTQLHTDTHQHCRNHRSLPDTMHRGKHCE